MALKHNGVATGQGHIWRGRRKSYNIKLSGIAGFTIFHTNFAACVRNFAGGGCTIMSILFYPIIKNPIYVYVLNFRTVVDYRSLSVGDWLKNSLNAVNSDSIYYSSSILSSNFICCLPFWYFRWTMLRRH